MRIRMMESEYKKNDDVDPSTFITSCDVFMHCDTLASQTLYVMANIKRVLYIFHTLQLMPLSYKDIHASIQNQ